MAEREEQQLEHDRDKHKRDRLKHSVLGHCILALIILVFSIIFFAIFTLGWHMLVPDSRQWLTVERLDDVKDFVLSGALVGLGTAYLRRFLDKQ